MTHLVRSGFSGASYHQWPHVLKPLVFCTLTSSGINSGSHNIVDTFSRVLTFVLSCASAGCCDVVGRNDGVVDGGGDGGSDDGGDGGDGGGEA